MKASRIKRLFLGVILVPTVVISAIILLAYLKQDAIVQAKITDLNENYTGKISVGDVHLAPFTNFPDISLKIDDVHIYESKEPAAVAIVDVADIYLGFGFFDVLSGHYDIHSLLVEDGFIDLVMHPDGSTNVAHALAMAGNSEEEEAIDFHLRKLEFKNVDVHQREEATNLDIETFIYWAKGGFNTKGNQIAAHIDSQFELNVMDNGDTTYLKHRHFEFHTDLVFDESTGMLNFKPSGIVMEHGNFEVAGSIDTKNEMTLDIAVKGAKPNFDLFIAFAPEELIPVLERYENAGKIYFDAVLQGPTTNGRQPFIDARFGAQEAHFENATAKRRIDHMGFTGHFTNGAQRNFETMEFSLTDMVGSLEKGKFVGNVVVKNFETPDINMQLDADFDIPFLVSFLNLEEVEDAKGSVEMKLKFHDVIDIDHPERALNDLNQAYFAELKIEDLSFNASDLPVPLKDLDVHIEMNGKKAQLDYFNLVLGNSNVSISGSLSDLPAIVHHTAKEVHAQLKIKSNTIDIAQLTNFSAIDSTGVDEQIENLSLGFSFNALGNAFTEYTHLPLGEFYIDNLYADLKHYPHTLHDFHADVIIKEKDLKIIDFTGNIDESDFHFNGLIHDFNFWMQEELNGDIDVDVTFKSDLLKFENLFAYQGENHVPKDYRHEEVKHLELHLNTSMHYKQNALYSIDMQLDKLVGKMHVHPLRFENFNGRFHYEDDHIMVQQFTGKMGRTQFEMDMNYYLGEDETIKKRDNLFRIKSDFIDFDALSSFGATADANASGSHDSAKTTKDVAEHAEAFNVYEMPFTDMQFNVDVGHFMYHRLDLKNIHAQVRTTHNHYIYLDTVRLDGAGGHIAMNGYFNGSDPEHIYLKPKMTLTDVDLDKLLFKFENFGQDAVVSENLHGQLTAKITGKIRVYPDLVVDLDQSVVHLDIMVLNGRLENYDPVMMLSDYFGDKDLTSIKFDTLQNHMDITNGTVTIPNMTIESTLGHMDISGTQDMNDNMDYYFRIPWSLVKQASKNKLFGAKAKDPATEDEIVELDPNGKTKYLNINVTGTFDDFSVKAKKQRH
ncbi:MAG: hypothetical protein ACJA2N_001901 [Salibacteraceae bacterium]|jgi:hypothetical protein